MCISMDALPLRFHTKGDDSISLYPYSVPDDLSCISWHGARTRKGARFGHLLFPWPAPIFGPCRTLARILHFHHHFPITLSHACLFTTSSRTTKRPLTYQLSTFNIIEQSPLLHPRHNISTSPITKQRFHFLGAARIITNTSTLLNLYILCV